MAPIASSLPPRPQSHRSRGNLPGGARRTRAAPTVEQAAMEREWARAEVELRVGSPASSSSLESVEQQDKTPLGLDEEQIRAALGGGPKVTPQTAKDVH
ncbi:hypothetical protein NDU88_001861 [Pleurodeles waltl]|uniref:Uncharacterized protein n=1 Tax=Pleurodeles waltl TaxID=8319 RepID=A0AAV7P5F8_PLEWA|nr:hypothetical protein NDU88_001861 [Pleurodeles waltl]